MKVERPWVCLLAVVAILTVAAAMPAMAGHLTDTSVHTTDSDFNNAQTLDNLSVEGSGTGASVNVTDDTYRDTVTIDPTEDQFMSSGDYGVTFETGDTPVENIVIEYEPNAASSVTEYATEAHLRDASGNSIESTSIPGPNQRVSFSSTLDPNTSYQVTVNDGFSDYYIGRRTHTTRSGEGVTVTGGVADGSTTTTNHYAIDYIEYDYQDTAGSATYVGDVHSADNVEEAFVDVDLTGSSSVSVAWEAKNSGESSWNTVATGSYSTDGEHAESVTGDYDQWRLTADFSAGVDTDAALLSEGVRSAESDPSFDNSTASPSGGELVTGSSVELSIDVEDPDFGTTQGDEVTVEWFVNGSKVDTTTHTQNETASITLDDPPTGGVEWHAEATDDEGHTGTSDTFTFQTPDELRIYEETDPGTLVTGSELNVTVRFYQEDEDNVVERTTDDGTVSMSDLPVDEEFIVTVDADGYEFRRVLVDSLLEQQDVFLLNSTEPSARVIFQLDDQTGRFPSSDTKLYVERALNQSGTTQYRVIAGDRFGASGEFPVALQDNDRYRLRIENDEGETRVLGAYTTSGDDRAILPIGRVELAGELGEDLVVQSEIRRVPDSADVSHEFEARVFVLDEAEQTESFTIEIVNETGHVVRPESTHDGPWGRYVETFPLDNYTEGDTYYVHVNATRNGEVREFREPIGDLPTLPSNWPIDPWVLQLVGYVSIVAFMGFMVIVSPTLAAISGVAYAALLTGLGIVPIPGLGIGVAGCIAILYRLGGDR